MFALSIADKLIRCKTAAGMDVARQVCITTGRLRTMSMEQVGRYIKQLREAQGLTQREAAARVGLHSKTIERWEAGSHEPRLTELAPYVKMLNGSLADVIELLTGDRIDQAILEAAHSLARLTPAQRQLLSELARQLLHESEVGAVN